jgi:IS5 family transposase
MKVYFHKRLVEVVVNDCNERIVRHSLKVIGTSDSLESLDRRGNGGGLASIG